MIGQLLNVMPLRNREFQNDNKLDDFIFKTQIQKSIEGIILFVLVDVQAPVTGQD